MEKRKTIRKRLLILLLIFLASVIINGFRYYDDLKHGLTHPLSYWALQVLIGAGIIIAAFFLGFLNVLMSNLYKRVKNK